MTSFLNANVCRAAIAVAAGCLFTACVTSGSKSEASQSATRSSDAKGTQVKSLADTEWRLVEVQSMDDAIGTKRVSDPTLYTMRLGKDGSVSMRLDCNLANGTWSAEAGPDASSGSFRFGPLAATRALCPPPRLDEQVLAQAQYFRSFLLKDGRLYLSLVADGGVFVWERHVASTAQAATKSEAELEAAACVLILLTQGLTWALAQVKPVRYSSRGSERRWQGTSTRISDGSVLLWHRRLQSYGVHARPKWVPVAEQLPLNQLPVIVSPARTGGWSDLWRLESGGVTSALYVRHTFQWQAPTVPARSRFRTAPS